MNCCDKDIRLISDYLQDDISKTIFSNRVLYSITGDKGYLRNVCMTIKEARKFDGWLKTRKDRELIIFGAGKWGNWIRETFDNYNWECFVDNNASVINKSGLPVIGIDELITKYKEACLVISSKFHWRDIKEQLVKMGINEDNIFLFGKDISEIESRIYFYLPQLISQQKEYFADVGGYDGESTKSFSKWANGEWYSKIFEPVEENRIKCRDNLSGLINQVEIIPKGVWDSETTLFFSENGYESGVSENTGFKIEVTTLDKVYKTEPCTFIKMDIEGSEISALNGAQNIIKKYRPKLAISIYHKAEDIIEIPKLIIKINPNYKLYLRHYSMTWFDTVLYAV